MKQFLVMLTMIVFMGSITKIIAFKKIKEQPKGTTSAAGQTPVQVSKVSTITIDTQKKALKEELIKVFDRILTTALSLGNKEDAQAFIKEIFGSAENTLAAKHERIDTLPHRAGMRQLTQDEKQEILRQADEMKSSNVYHKYLKAHSDVIADETFEDEVIARAKLARERYIGFEYIKGYVEHVSKQTAKENIPGNK